ncbi:MAG: hypothetical protein A2445_03400 [Candidatus Jacksonbacteria bacterium RIFOXYC2_FULL_44_29]|nr:MAG: Bifunctional GMP synthase/glutamine amidotransferase protein [Parcubacteria group bacterium GW2011_GWC2_44_22]OGY76493.1 MAG: hypothetical protein A2240_04500 [Candidatus Jacksonbacteria bacterium RIFOXYA2_FULL_43_12]OGY77283.1 MAG: hypothetical protein A2295_04995 [Candidatus Jacksonbacteria bacterium RIFOXYB2_FULL_44_15]OGY78266.1 MAG: hypothetical protein A2445_03400 [Candidatus Jacksonbacteria bacterium RIFOXYC2_FULL_44_29]OGY78911.1 MAG: hypothetical protein A2550_05235 [Candidatus
MTKSDHQQIAILDFGSQYTHLISRRIRDFNVYSRIYPTNVPASTLKKQNLIGLILSGGPNSVYDQTAPKFDPRIFDLGLPTLGLCYGHQLMAQHFGGEVRPGKVREYGVASLKLKIDNLFYDLHDNLVVWMSHGDSVAKLPTGFEVIGSTADCPVAAMANRQKRLYGLQFHPEVHHTRDDNRILYNFAINICGAKGDWQIDDLLAEILNDIKLEAKGKKIFMLVSGGVDSSVAFALLEKALDRENVLGLHIDSGLMRQNESSQVKNDLEKAGFDNLNIASAEDTFLDRLAGIADPEEKRRIIGETYLDVAESWFEKNVHVWNDAWLLGQGTIYPDTIESGGTREADKIKTHHNRIPRIQKMIREGRVIEPLKNFYKDEVRQIGRRLCLPEHLLTRHPFPGPGLAVMILCSPPELTLPKITLPTGTRLLPIQSTGVQGDQRSYAYPLMIAKKMTPKALEKFSTSITNRYREINRVVRLLWARGFSEKNIKLTKMTFRQTPNLFVTKDRLDLLRAIQAKISYLIDQAGLDKKIWEFPIVLLPLGIDGGQSIVLRPISSQEAMTVNFYSLPATIIKQIIKIVSEFPQIDALFYDVTNKPPATIQWE